MNERIRSRPSRADRPALSLGRYVRADATAITIAIAAVLLVGIIVLAGPARIGHLSVTNASEYDINIELTSGQSGTWLPFAVVGQRSTREFQDVLDQGDTWVFAVSAQGRTGGEITVSRTDLEAAGWKFTVPDSAIERIRQDGAPPSPCFAAQCPPSSR
jgi:hypothetical protein